MAVFASVLIRAGSGWFGTEIELAGCESLTDVVDVADAAITALVDDHAGGAAADVRLIFVEEDDEYAAIVRLDSDEQVRAFLSNAYAAATFPTAALIADELVDIGPDEPGDDADNEFEGGGGYEDAPLGDLDIVEDLGTSPGELARLCEREGMLPIDVLAAVCDRAECADVFDDIRA